MRLGYKVEPGLWNQVDAFTAAHRAVLNQSTRRPSPLINEDELDLAGQKIGVAGCVEAFVSGDAAALNWLARYSRWSNAASLALSESLRGAAFLDRLAAVMRDDARSAYDALCVVQNLWWASSDRWFYTDCLIDSVMAHLSTEHCAAAFGAAVNFAANSPDQARALVERSIVPSVVAYFAAHPDTHSGAREPLRLVLCLYQRLDTADFPRLAPVARHVIAYVSDRWSECRAPATYCALAMLTSDVDDELVADAADALVHAQLLFFPAQVEPLAKAFRLLVARGMYHLLKRAVFFEGLARTLDNAHRIDDDVFRSVTGVVCDVMAVDGDALIAAGILRKLVAVCDTGRSVLRVAAAAVLTQALAASSLDACAALVEMGALTAVLGVVGSASSPDIRVMLMAIARIVADGGEGREIVRESDFWAIRDEVDTEDQECLDQIDAMLQELDA
jgi:hypothetical protein